MRKKRNILSVMLLVTFFAFTSYAGPKGKLVDCSGAGVCRFKGEIQQNAPVISHSSDTCMP